MIPAQFVFRSNCIWSATILVIAESGKKDGKQTTQWLMCSTFSLFTYKDTFMNNDSQLGHFHIVNSKFLYCLKGNIILGKAFQGTRSLKFLLQNKKSTGGEGELYGFLIILLKERNCHQNFYILSYILILSN